MLKLSHTKSGVGLLTTSFLAYPTRMGGPSLALHRPSQDFAQVGPMRIPYFRS